MRQALRTGLLLAALVGAGVDGVAAAGEGEVVPLQVPDSAAPTFTVYTSRDGLGDEIWSTVGFAPDGVVWAGSASALARFDGYRWEPVVLAQARSLVRDMAVDADGTLWAIFESDGLFRSDGQGWHQVGTVRYHTRFSVLADGEGRRELWVGHGSGVTRLQGGGWVEDPGNGSVPPGPVSAIARTQTLAGGPREWLGSQGRGLWYRELSPTPGPWQRYAHPALDAMAISDLHRSADGDREELWVLSYGAGVARVRADGIRVWRADSGELPTEAIYTIAESHTPAGERSLWLSSRAGLLRFHGDHFDVFDRRHGLPADAVRGVKVQRGGDGVDTLWVATEGGLARATLSDNPWRTVSLLGAADNGVFGVLVEPNGRGGERLWLGSSRDGLAMLENGAWRSFTEEHGELPARSVRGLWRLRDSDGRPRRLLSMVGAPLLEIGDDLVVRPVPTPWPVTPENHVSHALSRKPGGHVEWWIATSHAGLWRRLDGHWQRIDVDANGGSPRTAWLADQVDREGHAWLWAADARGLARFDGERWQRVDAAAAPPVDGYRSLTLFAADGRQVLWAGSNNGLLRLDVSDPLQPRAITDDPLPPPPDRTFYSVLGDRHGRVYVCTNNGVQQLTPRRGGGWDERVFRRRDGLVHDECNTGSQFIDAHDRYWVGTLGGLAMFDPQAQPATATATRWPLEFTSLRVDGEVRAIPDSGVLRLPPDVQEVRIEYSLLTGQREGESRYRTQLVGLESAAGAWTAERSRSFSALPPGDYLLRIDARDFAGTLAQPRELHLAIALRWWQHEWLQLLAAGVALLLAAFAVLAWNRGLRARQKQLRQLVAERTQDLHSANLRLTELSYLDPLTGIANRRRLLEVLASAIARASAQDKPIGLLVADVDHFKQYNDQHGHLAGDTALRAIAIAMGSVLRSQDLVARFGGEEFACVMIDADLELVSRVAERMRALIEALPPRALGNDAHTLTISIGLLSCVPLPGQTPEALLHAADVALYDAKEGGRNQVRVAAPD